MARFGIIGAGLAGITLARELQHAGHACEVFDKGRGLGGRLATRRRGQWQVDHGAQYFTARDPAFRQEVERWLERQWIAEWKPELGTFDGTTLSVSPDNGTRYVGTPSMSAPVKGLSDGVACARQTRISGLERIGSQWELPDEAGKRHGPFDAVCLTAPLEQTRALLPEDSTLMPALQNLRMQPTWALALEFDHSTGIPVDGVFVKEGSIRWAARNSSKPGRASRPEVWVLHFEQAWTEQNPDATEPELRKRAIAFLQKLAESALPAASDGFSHRWLYALSQKPQADLPVWDAAKGLGLAGDWTAGDRVEGAWLSAKRLASAITQSL